MRAWGIGKRNLKELYRDRVAVGFLLGMPLAFILIFSFAFGGQGSSSVSLGIVDEDRSQISAAFIGALESTGALDIESPVFSERSEAENELNTGELPAYLLIPQGFGEALEGRQDVDLSLAYNETDPMLPQRIMPVVREASLQFLGIAVPLNVELSEKAAEVEDAYVNFLVPGMAVFGLMILITSVGGIMVRDRVMRFLSRLMTTPARPKDFIFGYTVPFIPVIIVSILIYLGVGILMGLTIVGNFGLAFLVLFIMGICCMGIGMVVGTLARTEDQASGAPWLFIMPAVMISGAWWPVEEMPTVLERIAEALPFMHAMDASRDVVTRGSGFSDVLTDLYWIVGWTVGLFALGIAFFRRSMAR
jgi:ABC-2 type transport system permease protein